MLNIIPIFPLRRIFQATTCLVAMAIALSGQDLTITYNTVTKMGMSQKDTQVVYYSPKYSRTNTKTARQDQLFDYNTFVTYTIDHKKKLISKIEFDDMVLMTELIAQKVQESKKDGQDVSKMLGISSNEAVSAIKVGSETVAGRECEKWNITLGKLKLVASADPNLEIPVPPEMLEKVKGMTNGQMMQTMGALLGDSFVKFLEEGQRIKGIQLKSEMTMPLGPMTMTTTRIATKITTDPIPASVFELPKGYKEEDLGKKMREELSKETNKKK
ncbi:MAG: hypothetical protein FWG02_03415 [Holophagaceae bacterium]|nr:hypothetical protein [Holophagaceae bacterium]